MGSRVVEQTGAEAGVERRHSRRAKRRARSWGLFILVAGLLLLLLYALAETVNRGLLVPAGEPTVPRLVPALSVADRYDWLAGAMAPAAAGDSLPAGWHQFDVAGQRAVVSQEDSYLRLECDQGPCISGVSRQLESLPAGRYRLEADVYLDGPYTGITARLGLGPGGGRDATAASVLWSVPGGAYGWQRLAVEADLAEGPATVFAIFDVLAAEGEGRVAGLRLLGPAATATAAAVAVATGEAPTAQPVVTEERVLLVGVSDLQWQSAAEIDGVVQRASEAGFTTVYLQVRHLGYAYYDSAVEPAAPSIAAGARARWDPLAEAIAAAHAAGLRLYAWVEMLPVWQGSEPPPTGTPAHMYDLFTGRYGSDWLQPGDPADPAALRYASPGQPQVRTYLASVCRDLAGRYQLDGLYLTGLAYAPGPATPTAEDADWRRTQLTLLLQEVATAVREARATAAISVAAGGEPALDAGRADFAVAAGPVPGAAKQLRLISADVRSFVSISRAIAEARQAGAAGVAIGTYTELETRGYWDDLGRLVAVYSLAGR